MFLLVTPFRGLSCIAFTLKFRVTVVPRGRNATSFIVRIWPAFRFLGVGCGRSSALEINLIVSNDRDKAIAKSSTSAFLN